MLVLWVCDVSWQYPLLAVRCRPPGWLSSAASEVMHDCIAPALRQPMIWLCLGPPQLPPSTPPPKVLNCTDNQG